MQWCKASCTVNRMSEARAKLSSGTVLYRIVDGAVEVLLVHPAGNYNRRAPWGIPKGAPDPDEELEATARRETLEETGLDDRGPLVDLGHVDYTRSKKRVHAIRRARRLRARHRAARRGKSTRPSSSRSRARAGSFIPIRPRYSIVCSVISVTLDR